MVLTEAKRRNIEEKEKYRAEMKSNYTPVLESKTNKNRIAAALLAIFLGSFGIHKFYLGKPNLSARFFLSFKFNILGFKKSKCF